MSSTTRSSGSSSPTSESNDATSSGNQNDDSIEQNNVSNAQEPSIVAAPVTTAGEKAKLEPEMKTEVEIAIGFLTHLVKQHHGADMAARFARELAPRLYDHYRDHWFPINPYKGMAYRCLRINATMDPLIYAAGRTAGLKTLQLRRAFPVELTMWVDPGEVSYRIGEEGSVCELFQTPETLAFSKQRPTTPAKNKGGAGTTSATGKRTTPKPHLHGSPSNFNHSKRIRQPSLTLQQSSPNLLISQSNGADINGSFNNNQRHHGAGFHPSNSFTSTHAENQGRFFQQHQQPSVFHHPSHGLNYETNTAQGFYHQQNQPGATFYAGAGSSEYAQQESSSSRSGPSSDLTEEKALEAASTMVQDIIKYLEQRDSGAAQAACYKENFERLVKCAIPVAATIGQA